MENIKNFSIFIFEDDKIQATALKTISMNIHRICTLLSRPAQKKQ